MPSVLIIGGGIIGLCSAYYLLQEGNDVTIIDKSDMLDGCSYGNAGYLSPSHFVPLASPGIVKQGLKWMLNSKSPFYVQPRFNSTLFNWGRHFIKSATDAHLKRSAIPLRDISLLSKNLYELLAITPGFDFSYEKKGMLEFFKTENNLHHARQTVDQSNKLGLEAELLSKSDVEKLEPDLSIDILGAIYFKCDAHLYPNKLMADLKIYLTNRGVLFRPDTEATGFTISGGVIKSVTTNKGDFRANEIVIAAGAFTGEVAKYLNLKIPMIGGRGYSVTYDDPAFKVKRPIILEEARVAITPMAGNKVRFGGTMEITAMNTPPKMNRVQGIFEGVKKYFPDFGLAIPQINNVWYGFRPCSADGLPYIGRHPAIKNMVVASGHAMLGLSLGAGTGKLVAEIINGKPLSVDLAPFRPGRF